MNKYFNTKQEKGFTIPELLVVIGVFGILSGIVVTNVFSAQHTSSLTAALDTIVTDIRQQQIKTMTGDTMGTGTITNYGIYFQANSYTLFHGASYSPSDSANFTVTLDPTIQFTADNFPGNTLLFSKGSGEMSNFISGSNSIILKDTSTGQTKTITINKYGVINQVN